MRRYGRCRTAAHHRARSASPGVRDGFDAHREYDAGHRRQHRVRRATSYLSPRRRQTPAATTATVAYNTERRGSSREGIAQISRRNGGVRRDHRTTTPPRSSSCCATDDDDGLCCRGDAGTHTDSQQQRQSENYHKRRQCQRNCPRSSRSSRENRSDPEEGLEFPQFVAAIEGVTELLTVGHDDSGVGGSDVVGSGSGGGKRGEGGGLKDDDGLSEESAGGIRREGVVTMTPELARTCLVRVAQVQCCKGRLGGGRVIARELCSCFRCCLLRLDGWLYLETRSFEHKRPKYVPRLS